MPFDRAHWRSANPYWVLPVILLTTFNVGLTTASRAELVLDVVCMARLPKSLAHGTVPSGFPIDPAECKRDAGVQSAVIRLTTLIFLTTGLLSALTTGFWMHKSNHVGRRKVMAGAVLGLLLDDLALYSFVSFPEVLRYSYYLLLIGAALEGIFGSFAVLVAAAHAYVADVTEEGSRAAAFARISACLMGGFIIGPTLGSAIAAAAGSNLYPFRFSIALNAVSVLCIPLVLPESLTEEQMHDKRGDSEGRLTPLRPLALLLPGARGHNLTLLVVGVFCLALLFGLVPIKIMYTQFVFGWNQANIGPFLSLVALSRFVVLLGVVPLVVSRLKPYYVESETTPLVPKRSSALDMTVLRASVAFEAVGLFLLAINGRGSQVQFLIGSLVSAIGSAHMPTAYSLGVNLVEPSEAAQLFGGLGILQSVATKAISPSAFGLVFEHTVKWYAPFTFAVAALLAVGAATMFSLVRIPTRRQPVEI